MCCSGHARMNRCRWDERTCAGAAWGGHLEVLQWLRANGCPWHLGTCMCAARGGHLEVLQWAHANGCPWNEDTCFWAATRGHLGDAAVGSRERLPMVLVDAR